MVFRPIIVLYYVISHVTCHSDHVPVGLLPGSGNPWDALRPHTHESAPGIPWSLPGDSGSDAIGDNDQQEQSIDLRMPGIRPSTEDAYVCTGFEISKKTQYIVQFEALATANVVHHMLLYGCSEPHSILSHWTCGQVCKHGPQRIIYAWARNAPPTTVPPDVGFEISGDSGTQYLVLQVHYKNPITAQEKADDSGMRLHLTQQPQQYIGGIYLLASMSLEIPANTPVVHSDISCQYNGADVIYPIAFRTHTHELGVVVTGYRFDGEYHLLGKGNPQWPQAFYPVQEDQEINPGEYLIGRCTYNSTNRNRVTNIGATHHDEMCNFYLMYYTSAEGGTAYYSCSSDSYPELKWGLPEGSDTALPPNPLLENIATGKTVNTASSTTHHQSNANDQSEGSYLQHSYQSPQHYANSNADYQQPTLYKPRKVYGSPVSRTAALYNVDTLRRNGNMYGAFFPAPQDDYNTRNQQTLQQPDSWQHGKANERGVSNERGGAYSSGETWQGGAINRGATSFKRTKGHQNLSNPAPDPAYGNASLQKKQHQLRAKSAVSEDHDWHTSDGITIGQIGGIATDSNDNIHVFHRGTRIWGYLTFNAMNVYIGENYPIRVNTLLTFNSTGSLKQQWGRNMFFMPHGLHIDKNDNVWLTDVALHQVFRFPVGASTPDLIVGSRMIPGSDHSHFCKPTDIAVLENGEFFVSDGYCNSRIMKFSADGTFIKSWGTQSVDTGDGFPPPGTFSLPHGVTLLPDLAWVCVADRMNGRIQCFDYDGTFTIQIHPTEFNGVIYGLSYSETEGVIYAVNGPVPSKTKTEFIKGFTIDPQNGHLMETWAPEVGFSQPHDIAVTSSGKDIFVGELSQNKLWKFSVKQELIEAFSSHRTVKNAGVLPIEGDKPSVKKDGVSTEPQISHGQKSTLVNTVIDSKVDSVVDNAGDGALDNTASTGSSNNKEEELRHSFGVSMLIGALLVIPVMLIVIVTILVRLYRAGKLPLFLKNSSDYHNRRFNLGGILDRSNLKGFTSLNMTDDTSELDHLNSDSEVEEFNATPMKA